MYLYLGMYLRRNMFSRFITRIIRSSTLYYFFIMYNYFTIFSVSVVLTRSAILHYTLCNRFFLDPRFILFRYSSLSSFEPTHFLPSQFSRLFFFQPIRRILEDLSFSLPFAPSVARAAPPYIKLTYADGIETKVKFGPL